jgi:probable HAF family extracellular repeat protein
LERLEDRWCPSTSSYSITDLGTLGGATSQANAINGAGQVVGVAQVASGSHHPFLYSGGVMTDLTLAKGFTDGSARAINSSGQVAVSEDVGGNVNNGDAFLYRSSSDFTDVGKLGGYPTVPLGINNETAAHPVQVVGYANHAWIWQDKTNVMTDLNTLLPANSGWVLGEADGINDSQQIVGQGIFNGQYHAFLWQIQQVAGSPAGIGTPTDLGTLPGVANSGAKAINNSGQVAGWSNTPPPNQDHAILWSSGQINDLGALPNGSWSNADALNNSSQVQVVGSSSSQFSSSRAVLWQGGTVIDLNSQLPRKSGWSMLELAYGINDAGQIVGEGQVAGSRHAFLMAPTSTKTAAAVASISPAVSTFSVAPSSAVAAPAPLLVSAIAPTSGSPSWHTQTPASFVTTNDPGLPGTLSKGRTVATDRLALKARDRVFGAFADDVVSALS